MGKAVQLVGAAVLVTAMALVLYATSGDHGCHRDVFFTLKGTSHECEARQPPKLDETGLVAELAK